MSADTITLPREQVVEVAAWLLAFEELFGEVEEIAPCSLGGEQLDLVWEFGNRLAGKALIELEDEEYDRHPVNVDLWARARELAAGMAKRVAAKEAAGEDTYPFTYYSSPLTAQGLRKVADKLALEAELTRSQGTISPKVAQHA